MSITLQDFATGDTNYVAKLNSNSDVLEAAINALQAITSGAALSTLSLQTAYTALFGTSVAVIGDASYVATNVGGSPTGEVSVSSGYAYLPSSVAVVSKATDTSLSFAGQTAGTYYIVVDNNGNPTISTSSTEAIYTVVWTGSAFTSITRTANVVWGAAEWIKSQTSTALGNTYTSLDARLEAAEASAGLLSVAQAPNTVLAGPVPGSPTNAPPTFRALVASDLPAGTGGSVTSVNITQPAAGITASGGPVTSAGSITLALANDLAAVEGLSSTGIVRRTGTDTWSAGTAVNLASEVTGVLPVANFATGTPTGAKFVRDDGVLAVPAGTSSGTVTSVNITQPSAGITASGGPVTTSGSITLALANDLAALEALSSTGLAARTGSDTWAQRTITAPAAGITVSNGDGVSGNPTLALANDLAALEALSSTGFAKRTGTDAWSVANLAYADLPTGLPGKPRVDAHTYASSVTLDCSSYDAFEITLTGPITIAFSGGTDGQRIMVRLTQDATGSRLVTWDSAVGFGTDIATATATTTANKVDYFGLVYSSASSKYHMVAMARGY